jgi:hypothetical protein
MSSYYFPSQSGTLKDPKSINHKGHEGLRKGHKDLKHWILPLCTLCLLCALCG